MIENFAENMDGGDKEKMRSYENTIKYYLEEAKKNEIPIDQWFESFNDSIVVKSNQNNELELSNEVVNLRNQFQNDIMAEFRNLKNKYEQLQLSSLPSTSTSLPPPLMPTYSLPPPIVPTPTVVPPQPVVSNPININLNLFPRFDGKAVEWNAFKNIVERMVIRNVSYDDYFKQSILLQILEKEPKRLICTMSSSVTTSAEMWNALCSKYDSPLRLWEEINEEIKNLPQVKGEDDVDNMKKIRDSTDAINQIVESMNIQDSFSVFATVQAIGNKFYYREQRQILGTIKTINGLCVYIDQLYEKCLNFQKYRIKKPDVESTGKKSKYQSAAMQFSKTCCLCEKVPEEKAACVKSIGDDSRFF